MLSEAPSLCRPSPSEICPQCTLPFFILHQSSFQVSDLIMLDFLLATYRWTSGWNLSPIWSQAAAWSQPARQSMRRWPCAPTLWATASLPLISLSGGSSRVSLPHSQLYVVLQSHVQLTHVQTRILFFGIIRHCWAAPVHTHTIAHVQ